MLAAYYVWEGSLASLADRSCWMALVGFELYTA